MLNSTDKVKGIVVAIPMATVIHIARGTWTEGEGSSSAMCIALSVQRKPYMD
jgi:hypothetical protein